MTALYAGAFSIALLTLAVMIGIAGMVVGKALGRTQAELD